MLALHADVDLACPPRHYPDAYHALARHLQRLLSDPEMRTHGGPITAIFGPVGVGKTALACGALRHSYDLGRPYVFYAPALLYVGRLLGKRQSQTPLFDNFCRADALVLDDMHDRGQSAWADAEIRLVVDIRYGNRKPTFLISNLDSEAFARDVGPQLHRRIFETGGFHFCQWPRLLGLPLPAAEGLA